MQDFIGATLSFIATCLFAYAHWFAWPISLIAIAINSALYWQNGIFADSLLEGFYFFSTLYGWFIWLRHNHHHTPIIRSLSKIQWGLILLSISFGYFILIQILSHTSSEIIALDAITTILSIIAQCLLCFKFIETWIFWFIADAIYAAIYYKKHLTSHEILMFSYIVIAFLGYLKWHQQSTTQLLSKQKA